MKKINNKIFTSLFFVIFFIIFSIFNAKEYIFFHNEKIEVNKNNELILEKASNFKLEDIREIENSEIYYTPYKNLLDKIVDKINKAENKVYIEVYMLTEKRIQSAIKNAHKRGVETKIILEKDPYMAYSINDKAFNNLKNIGVNIVWSNDKNFALNHTKMLIIDDLSIISTGNLTYSTFTKNRDFFIFSTDNILRENLEKLFLIDFEGKNTGIYSENLVLSPIYSREKLEDLILSAKKDIKIYIQYFKDEGINKILISQKNKGVNIEIVTAKTAMDDDQTKKLIKAGINIKQIPKYKMHSKAIFVDNEYLFIGSINFSEYSIDKNREIGIILKNKEIISKFLDIFSKDYK